MIGYEETKSQPITEMGQMRKGFREETSFWLSSHQIQRKSDTVCSLAIGTSVRNELFIENK